MKGSKMNWIREKTEHGWVDRSVESIYSFNFAPNTMGSGWLVGCRDKHYHTFLFERYETKLETINRCIEILTKMKES